MKAEAWELVQRALATRGFTRSKAGTSDCFRGIIQLGSVKVEVDISFDDFDFVSLPRVRVLNREALPKPIKAHLIEGGLLCYAEQTTLLLDLYQPDKSALLVLDLVRDTLTQVFHGNPAPAVENEFFAYWQGDPYLFVDSPLALEEAVLGTVSFRKGHHVSVAARDADRLKAWAASAGANGSEIDITVPVIRCRGPVVPPSRTIETFAAALDWAKSQAHDVDDVGIRAVSQSSNRPGLFLAGSNGIFGFLAVANGVIKASTIGGFRQASRTRLWLSQASKLKVDRVRGFNADHREIVSRNLAGRIPLAGKNIVLVGCGTLGSYLARGLVQCGAGCGAVLMLVDSDALGPGNIGRHLLGVRYLGRNKAEALAEAVNCDFPDVRIEAVAKPAQSIKSRLRAYDLVIDATGSEQFSNALNRWALDSRSEGGSNPFAVLYAFLEGNGVAARTFYYPGTDHVACYRCMRPAFHRQARYPSLKPEFENPEVAVRPCGDVTFVPFSVDATMVASSLALSHAVDAVSGAGSPTLRTRVIDGARGINQIDRNLSPAPSCPACGEAEIVS